MGAKRAGVRTWFDLRKTRGTRAVVLHAYCLNLFGVGYCWVVLNS